MKPGPKPMPPGKRRSQVIGVRVTPAEYRKFERMAGAEHLSLAAWGRRKILAAIEYELQEIARRGAREALLKQQEEKLDETTTLLKKTMRLYQSAAPKRSK